MIQLVDEPGIQLDADAGEQVVRFLNALARVELGIAHRKDLLAMLGAQVVGRTHIGRDKIKPNGKVIARYITLVANMLVVGLPRLADGIVLNIEIRHAETDFHRQDDAAVFDLRPGRSVFRDHPDRGCAKTITGDLHIDTGRCTGNKRTH